MRGKERHLIVRSRNTTCAPLRELVVPGPTILRLGSVTPTEKITKAVNPKEINCAQGCKISGDKFAMKVAFDLNNIPTAEWAAFDNGTKVTKAEAFNLFHTFNDKVIVKHIHSSKGNGIYFFTDKEKLYTWMKEHELVLGNYIFERYYTYTREYRIHVTKYGCFYACRKMLKADANVRWHRHNTNSVWITEENLLFDKPTNWDDIVNSCIDALFAVGLDIAAFDVKVQSNKHNKPKYIILESNSAPSLGKRGIDEYKKALTKLIYG